ncbi:MULTISPECIES: amidohydrolase family protein [unclassified Sphingomonas]|uniref:amidohydrolase family protein n=1 Tax=unclassified Sphingomonas TaxID=196159 RepID=UPI0006FD40A9|nr:MULTISPECIES: amidohydrolase family protein [unclassified Sphingomonas]KQX23450.1 hypothetical protein ASD17_03890 [Sphingomonas sp. Root1294]KQY68301.1 hypothetical protein ASD39_06410 [Sphingomonas sp. Root50]KRB91200.1 hypothetical protein ASE22_13215 [Sphingomonas sp. Root720]
MSYPIISADSHITETTDTYARYIDARYKDDAPFVVEENDSVAFAIKGMGTIAIGGAAAAGIAPAERKKAMRRYLDLHRGGWDSSHRLADQDRDGVSAEVIYPTVGMILCNHPDLDYKDACFKAYNRWLSDYCDFDRSRLLGMGQTAMKTPQAGIEDLAGIKAQGLRGIMMPGVPGVEDYDSPVYDDFWAAAVDSGLPVAFHIIAAGGFTPPVRGSKINTFMNHVRGVQDILGMLIFGGVFERHPDLKVVCVEGDGGWIAHYAHKIDRAYTEHRHHLPTGDLKQMPSHYLFQNLYFTFQDDPLAFRNADLVNWRRLLWANDFPHSDSTWPTSQSLLAEHTRFVTPEQKQAILSGNAAELFGIDLTALDQKRAA